MIAICQRRIRTNDSEVSSEIGLFSGPLGCEYTVQSVVGSRR